MNHCSDDPLERNDLLQKILNLYEQQEVKITNMDVFHQVFTIILAGHETLSFTLTFAIFLLAKHYKIQESARLEISKVVRNSHMVTLEEVEQLSVLNNCIKETLRLYPVTITSSRKTIREVKLGPYCIPPRTTVSVCIAALNRDEKVWENGADFDPARHNKQGILLLLSFLIHCCLAFYFQCSTLVPLRLSFFRNRENNRCFSYCIH